MADILKHLDLSSADGAQLNMDALYQIAPSAFTEVRDDKTGEISRKVNFEVLRQLLGDNATDGDGEMYQFTWVGKNAARAEAAAPTTKTLRPVVEDSVDWDNTKNIYIEGDNLEVLKLLQRSYMGKVKMIYIDPPYNTGNDFVYHDDFARTAAEEDLEAGNIDELGNRYRKNTDSNGRFHSDWCSMIYARLLVARSLLTEDGVIFISIDDNEVDNLKKICTEVFGESCFVCAAIWRSSDNSNNDAKQFSLDHNTTLIFSKSPDWQPAKQVNEEKQTHYKNPDNDPKGPWFDGNPLNSPNYRENLRYEIIAPNGNVIQPPANGWRWSKETLEAKMASGEIYFNATQTNIKRRTYLCDAEGLPPSSLWIDLEKTGHNRQAKYELLNLMPENVFDTPKPIKLLKFMLSLLKESKNAIIMDFFSGSGTTAHAVMQQNSEDNGNRSYIMVQLPEDLDQSLATCKKDSQTVLKNAISLCDTLKKKHSLAEIAKERIRRAGKKIKADSPLTTQDLDTGFRVYRLDESNYENVSRSPKEYKQEQLELFANNIKADRTDLDLLYGAMLAWGVRLDLPLQTETVDGCTIYTVNEGDLVACFAKGITDKVVATMAEKSPLRVLFRDACFKEDAQKINIYEQFKQALDWADNDAFKNIRVM